MFQTYILGTWLDRINATIPTSTQTVCPITTVTYTPTNSTSTIALTSPVLDHIRGLFVIIIQTLSCICCPLVCSNNTSTFCDALFKVIGVV